jgi:hypothetical protein
MVDIPTIKRQQCALSARPCLNEVIYQLPASEIEIPNAKVGPVRNLECIRQGGVQTEIDIVEDSWQAKFPETQVWYSHYDAPS